jgi:predicted nicotinamide N-methyase
METTQKTKRRVSFSEKQGQDIKELCWMGFLWASSLVDAKVPNGKSDLAFAKRVLKIVNKKIKLGTINK